MKSFKEIKMPEGFGWQRWVDRWDRMQERYLVRRDERFALIVSIIRETQDRVSRVLNLGCGPGSLMEPLLESFPQAEVFGVDFDPTMLLLARERLSKFGERARLLLADLRAGSWFESLPGPMDAVVSATALHWLSAEQLAVLYGQIEQTLRPGGIFLNADHVANDFPPIQKAWERNRAKMFNQEGSASADDWEGFWEAYGQALRLNIRELHQSMNVDWEAGVEEGLPLAWHFDRLRESGFASVDCFWRSDGDAIYGGICNRKNSR